MSRLWKPPAERWKVLQPVRNPTTLPSVRHSFSGKELLPQLRTGPQSLTPVWERHVCVLILSMFSCIRDSHMRPSTYYWPAVPHAICPMRDSSGEVNSQISCVKTGTLNPVE